jgi:FkbM family methyltransferase
MQNINPIAKLEMPNWIFGTRLEDPLRSFARRVKKTSISFDRKIRKGRVGIHISSLKTKLYFDYDFLISNSITQNDALLESMMTWLEPGQTLYDIGGFVGLYSLAAAHLVGNQGNVVAFEPVPEVASLLRRHLAMNAMDNRVRVFEAACGDKTAIGTILSWSIKSTSWASGSSFHNIHPQDELEPSVIPVICIKLDDLIGSGLPVPDAIKIDVEGAELSVLNGAVKLLENVRPWVFLEVHPFAWPSFGVSKDDLLSFVHNHAYEILFPITFEPMNEFPNKNAAHHVILKPC